MNTSLKGLVLQQKCNQRLHASIQGLSQHVHYYYFYYNLDNYHLIIAVVLITSKTAIKIGSIELLSSLLNIDNCKDPIAATTPAAVKSAIVTVIVLGNNHIEKYSLQPFEFVQSISHQASPETVD